MRKLYGRWFDSFIERKATHQDLVIDPSMNSEIEEDNRENKTSGEFYEN